jgi:hypothetical protein
MTAVSVVAAHLVVSGITAMILMAGHCAVSGMTGIHIMTHALVFLHFLVYSFAISWFLLFMMHFDCLPV